MIIRAPATRRTGRACIVCLALLIAPATVRSAPDCFPDRVASFVPGSTSAPPLFNSWQPGIVLGPPGDATPTTGSLTVLSLGHGGSITLEFTDNVIVDGPGPDLIVFENPFFCTQAPASDGDTWSVLAEPGRVAVSEDGIVFHPFPFDGAALAEVVALCSDRDLVRRLIGLAGLTPNISGNYTVADDPLVFDAGAAAGISGHGGDAFDLADVGLSRARFVRIDDPDLSIGIPGASEGFDLDAVVALNSEASPAAGGGDRDGDGLTDEAEVRLYLTDPDDPDSDGDGEPDGREVAGCRDPRTALQDPFFLPLIDLEVAVPSPTSLRWSTAGPGRTYDVVRGVVRELAHAGGLVDLGVVTCIEAGSTDLTTRFFEDAATPFPGEAFYYAVRVRPDAAGLGYGLSSGLVARAPASGDCP